MDSFGYMNAERAGSDIVDVLVVGGGWVASRAQSLHASAGALS